MKQQETTVFLAFLSLISFCLGHAAIEVQQFGAEPIIVWLVIVLPTGNKYYVFNTFKQNLSMAKDATLTKRVPNTLLCILLRLYFQHQQKVRRHRWRY